MRGVKVFFKAEERGGAEIALRALDIWDDVRRGVEFDDAVYTGNGNVVELIRDDVAYVVPMRNILLVRILPDQEVRS